jgi:N-acylglucosamine-6-phosphate 2-epimerase
VGTTLYGYTEATKTGAPPAFGLLSQLREALPAAVPLVCEGGIASPEQAQQALKEGADFVVVGTAITGVDLQVTRYVETLRQGSQIFL